MRIQTKAYPAITAKTPNILDSDQVRFISGGVTIDSTLVTAAGDGTKVLPIGTILAKVTATGKFAEYDSAQTDGRQTPLYILYPDQADVTDGDGAFGAIDMARIIKSRMPKQPDATVISALKTITFVD
jgi:hypothetical protein